MPETTVTATATGGSVSRALPDWFAGMGRDADEVPPAVGFWSDQGPVNLWKMRDRVFIGSAAVHDGGFNRNVDSWLGAPEVTPGDGNLNYHWVERSSQMHVGHSQGGIAILGTSRTSDGVTGQTATGLASIVYANVPARSAWGAYIEAVRGAPVGGVQILSSIHGVEVDVRNVGDRKEFNAYNMFVGGGMTMGLWLAAGGDSMLAPFAQNPSSVALGIGNNSAQWIHGLMFRAGGLEGTTNTDADTGTGHAIQMPKQDQIEWVSPDGSISAYIKSRQSNAANPVAIEFSSGQIQMLGGAGVPIIAHQTTATSASNVTSLLFTSRLGTESAILGVVSTAANADLSLAPKGTGLLKFGTHAALAAETVTGYITIKDAGGTSRKLAVVA